MDIGLAVDVIAREKVGHFSLSLVDAEWTVLFAVGRSDRGDSDYARVSSKTASSFEEAWGFVSSEMGLTPSGFGSEDRPPER